VGTARCGARARAPCVVNRPTVSGAVGSIAFFEGCRAETTRESEAYKGPSRTLHSQSQQTTDPPSEAYKGPSRTGIEIIVFQLVKSSEAYKGPSRTMPESPVVACVAREYDGRYPSTSNPRSAPVGRRSQAPRLTSAGGRWSDSSISASRRPKRKRPPDKCDGVCREARGVSATRKAPHADWWTAPA
jgi:hypothetical protein